MSAFTQCRPEADRRKSTLCGHPTANLIEFKPEKAALARRACTGPETSPKTNIYQQARIGPNLNILQQADGAEAEYQAVF